jgi:hypothetical protein
MRRATITAYHDKAITLSRNKGCASSSIRTVRRQTVITSRTVAEILKAFWAFLGIASPDCNGFKKQSHFSGVARSTYVGSPFSNTSRVGGGVELKITAIFVLIRAEIGPTKK